MKLYAQAGFGIGEKVASGLSEGLIGGAIFSPKDPQRATLERKISEMRDAYPAADLFLDPQFYVSLFADLPTTNVGNLPDWHYFRSYRKGELELESTVEGILKEFYK